MVTSFIDGYFLLLFISNFDFGCIDADDEEQSFLFMFMCVRASVVFLPRVW